MARAAVSPSERAPAARAALRGRAASRRRSPRPRSSGRTERAWDRARFAPRAAGRPARPGAESGPAVVAGSAPRRGPGGAGCDEAGRLRSEVVPMPQSRLHRRTEQAEGQVDGWPLAGDVILEISVDPFITEVELRCQCDHHNGQVEPIQPERSLEPGESRALGDCGDPSHVVPRGVDCFIWARLVRRRRGRPAPECSSRWTSDSVM